MKKQYTLFLALVLGLLGFNAFGNVTAKVVDGKGSVTIYDNADNVVGVVSDGQDLSFAITQNDFKVYPNDGTTLVKVSDSFATSEGYYFSNKGDYWTAKLWDGDECWIYLGSDEPEPDPYPVKFTLDYGSGKLSTKVNSSYYNSVVANFEAGKSYDLMLDPKSEYRFDPGTSGNKIVSVTDAEGNFVPYGTHGQYPVQLYQTGWGDNAYYVFDINTKEAPSTEYNIHFEAPTSKDLYFYLGEGNQACKLRYKAEGSDDIELVKTLQPYGWINGAYNDGYNTTTLNLTGTYYISGKYLSKVTPSNGSDILYNADWDENYYVIPASEFASVSDGYILTAVKTVTYTIVVPEGHTFTYQLDSNTAEKIELPAGSHDIDVTNANFLHIKTDGGKFDYSLNGSDPFTVNYTTMSLNLTNASDATLVFTVYEPVNYTIVVPEDANLSYRLDEAGYETLAAGENVIDIKKVSKLYVVNYS